MTKDAAPGAGSGDDYLPDLFAPMEAKDHYKNLKATSPEIFADFDSSGQEYDGLEGVALPTRGRGRPPGAPNKQTSELQKFILGRYGDPVLAGCIFGIWRDPVELLSKVRFVAKELNLSNEKALDFVVSQQKFIAPYVRSQLPVALRVESSHEYRLVVDSGGWTLPEPLQPGLPLGPPPAPGGAE